MEGFSRNKDYLGDLLKQGSIKILFLQEIWLPYHDKPLMSKCFPDYSFNIATPDMFHNNEDKFLSRGPVWHGCAIGWHNDINSNVEPVESNYERLVGVKFNLKKQSFLLIYVYAPTAGHDDKFGRLQLLIHVNIQTSTILEFLP